VDKDQSGGRRKALTVTIFDQVRQIASDVFVVPVESIEANSSPDTIEAWDSMTHLNLVLALEERFHLHLLPEEMESMRSVGRIAALFESKLSRDTWT
jgi:acyl carrier protein